MYFVAILATLELVLSKVGESFLSKVGELIADSAMNNAKNILNLEATLKNLQKNLKSLSCKAQDVKEQIKNEEVSGQKKRKREVEEWLRQVESIEAEIQEMGTQVEGIITRLMDGGKAAQLNEQVEKLVDQSRNFGELFLDVCGVRGITLLTNEMVGEAFEENLERIWRILETKEVSSIGVHGVGDAGKTALAKHIHNRLVERSEGTVCWVTVSKEYSIKSLQDKIARSLGVKLLSRRKKG